MSQQTSAPGFEKHPNYEVQIDPRSERIRILAGDSVLLDTSKPLLVTETKHHPVWYLPLADADQSLLQSTDHSTYCPFKGNASYYSIVTADQKLENAVWSYQDPYMECLPLKEYLSFYTDRVSLEIDGELQDTQGPGWSG